MHAVTVRICQNMSESYLIGFDFGSCCHREFTRTTQDPLSTFQGIIGCVGEPLRVQVSHQARKNPNVGSLGQWISGDVYSGSDQIQFLGLRFFICVLTLF